MEKHFIQAHWTLFLIFSSIGFFPLGLDKCTLHMKESIGRILYWLAVFVAINTVCLQFFRPQNWTGNWNGLVVKFSEWCVLILIVTDLSCALFQALISRHTHMQLLNDIDIIDFIICNKYSRHARRKSKNYSLPKLLYLQGIWAVWSIMKIINHKDRKTALQEGLMSFPIFWLTNVRVVMHSFYIELITERIKIVNRELMFFGNINCDPTFIKRDQANYRNAVVKIQDTYTRIWKCFMKVNDIFGWPTVTLVLRQFIFLIVTSFWCINKQKTANSYGSNFSESFMLVIDIISNLLFLCHSASNCKREAAITADALLKPEYDYEDLDTRDFLAQMQHQPFLTTASGFFDINYGLLGSTLATTVTYIVIILQLEAN